MECHMIQYEDANSEQLWNWLGGFLGKETPTEVLIFVKNKVA